MLTEELRLDDPQMVFGKLFCLGNNQSLFATCTRPKQKPGKTIPSERTDGAIYLVSSFADLADAISRSQLVNRENAWQGDEEVRRSRARRLCIHRRRLVLPADFMSGAV